MLVADSKSKLYTICTICKGAENPNPHSDEPIDGIIYTDVLDHFYFTIEHNEFDSVVLGFKALF